MSTCVSPRPNLRALPGAAAGCAGAEDSELVALVYAARAGHPEAWTALVRRFERRLRAIGRSYRLPPSDVDDVVQATWLELLKDIGKLREPAAIAGWLATTTRRMALRAAQAPMRCELSDDPWLGERPDPEEAENRLAEAQRKEILARAVATLPDRHRRLMDLLLQQPTLDYKQIGQMLDMPHGSIGPIRGRCLERLQRHPELRALRDS